MRRNSVKRGTCVMSVEYIAVIAEEDYHAFTILVSTPLPREYDMWLRVRERGRLRIIQERDASVVDIEVRPEEFGAYCKSLKKPDFIDCGCTRHFANNLR